MLKAPSSSAANQAITLVRKPVYDAEAMQGKRPIQTSSLGRMRQPTSRLKPISEPSPPRICGRAMATRLARERQQKPRRYDKKQLTAGPRKTLKMPPVE